MTTLNYENLKGRYDEKTSWVHCKCILATDLVGGQPAKEGAIRSFVTHHLAKTNAKLLDPAEAEKVVQRILHEEIGERNVTPENGELEEEEVYQVNVIRSTEHGPWLGDWMVKANIKMSASRLGLYQEHKGTKGDFAHTGKVSAMGISLVDPQRPDRIYLRKDGGPAPTFFEEFMGRVPSAQGAKSIFHHSECVGTGTEFEYGFQFLPGKLDEEDIADIMAFAMIVGLGSAKSFERGKFRIEKCEIEMKPDHRNRKPVKKEEEEEEKRPRKR